FKAKLARGHVPLDADPRMTVGEYLDRWLDTTAKMCVRPTTLVRYRQLVKLRIKPRLGGYPLAKLTPDAVMAWLGWLAEQPVGVPVRRRRREHRGPQGDVAQEAPAR